jgi:hypothetical protein
MTRYVLIACMLAACFQSHPSGQREVAGEDCYGCHATDYAATTAPVHRDAPQVFSTACTGCHIQVSWKPALEGKHSDLFAIADGPHAPTACLGCHDLATAKPSKQGANTNCLQCHPNDAKQIDSHADIEAEIGRPYAYLASVPNFCLDCHPAGTADVHPEKRFALTKDHAVACADCHDRAAGKDKGGANVTCVESRCHHTLRATDGTEGHEDGDYQKARGNGSSRNFCHNCHS